MIYAVSGSQGSGKSTTLTELERRGYPVMRRKISRSILADWDVSLKEVNTNLELSLKFQNEILTRKANDEMAAVISKHVHFTERTFMDSMTYYIFTFGSRGDLSNEINDYYDRCCEYDSRYNGVFLLPFGQFNIESDGVRNANTVYGESIDVVLRNFLRKSETPLYEVTARSVGERCDYIENVIKSPD